MDGYWKYKEFEHAKQLRAMGYLYREIAEILDRDEMYVIKKFHLERKKERKKNEQYIFKNASNCNVGKGTGN